MRYCPGEYQYTEGNEKAADADELPLLLNHGFDILMTHAPAYRLGDGEDLPHRDFRCSGHCLTTISPGILFMDMFTRITMWMQNGVWIMEIQKFIMPMNDLFLNIEDKENRLGLVRR